MGEILLIGENRERARDIRSLLRQDGHEVTWSRKAGEWRELEQSTRPEIVVAAVAASDPVLQAPPSTSRGFPAPLLFVQHDNDLFQDVHLEERLVDRLQSPFNAEELLARIDALIRLRRFVMHDRSRTTSGNQRGVRRFARRLAALLRTRLPRVARPVTPYLEVVARVAAWADRRDMFEPGHAERVTSLAAMIADGLGLADSEASPLMRAAMLHDIGKVALPIELLRKQGPLEEEQMRLMRTHPERGANLLNALDPDDAVADTIRFHHERVDGKGYYGKSRENVPRSAHILAVAETYDAMTTSRVRETVGSDRALGMLRDTKGSAFDDDCVDALVSAMKPRPKCVPLSAPVLPPSF